MDEYDSIFPFLLGRFTGTTVNYNYNTSGTAFPLYTPSVREFAYNEVELYGQDTWRLNSNLTMNFGLRWQYHAVPYEVNGFESVSTVDETQLFGARVAAAAQGINGNAAAPLISYILGGPKNHGPGYYNRTTGISLQNLASPIRHPSPKAFWGKYSATANPASAPARD